MGFTSTMKHPDGKLELQLHTGKLRGLLVLGIGAGGSMALCLGAFDLIAHDPVEGFALLKSYGPWSIVVAFAMFLLWKLCSEVIGFLKVGADAFLRNTERQAIATETQAAALARLADKDDRAAQEMQTLTAVTAQRAEKTHAMLQAYHEANSATMDRIESKLDKAIEEWRAT